jgi:hypothetical protein
MTYRKGSSARYGAFYGEKSLKKNRPMLDSASRRPYFAGSRLPMAMVPRSI